MLDLDIPFYTCVPLFWAMGQVVSYVVLFWSRKMKGAVAVRSPHVVTAPDSLTLTPSNMFGRTRILATKVAQTRTFVSETTVRDVKRMATKDHIVKVAPVSNKHCTIIFVPVLHQIVALLTTPSFFPLFGLTVGCGIGSIGWVVDLSHFNTRIQSQSFWHQRRRRRKVKGIPSCHYNATTALGCVVDELRVVVLYLQQYYHLKETQT